MSSSLPNWRTLRQHVCHTCVTSHVAYVTSVETIKGLESETFHLHRSILTYYYTINWQEDIMLVVSSVSLSIFLFYHLFETFVWCEYSQQCHLRFFFFTPCSKPNIAFLFFVSFISFSLISSNLPINITCVSNRTTHL